MIDAISDKIILESLRVGQTKEGLIIPDTVAEPQGYGKVISFGEEVSGVKKGDILVYHVRAGMDAVLGGKLLKVIKFEEVYGKLADVETKKKLELIKIGPPPKPGETQQKGGVVIAS